MKTTIRLYSAAGWGTLLTLWLLGPTLPGPAVAQAPAASAAATPAAALAAFARQAQGQGLSAADVADPLVTDSYVDAGTGLTHTYLQQRVNGLAVFNATGAVHTDRAGRVVLLTQQFVPGAAATAPPPAPALSPEQAVAAAARALQLPRPVALRRLREARAADGLLLNGAGISEQPIPVQLLYARQGGRLVLAWNVTIAQLDQAHHYSLRLDAHTGQPLDRTDYTVQELNQATAPWLEAQTQLGVARPAATRPAARAPAQVAAPAHSLTVLAVPTENPTLAARTSVLLSSANPTYSPYGWQVGDGRAPAGTFSSYPLGISGATLTRGNNVLAVDGYSNNSNMPNSDILSATNSPSGGSDLIFDFPLDATKSPRDPGNLAAAITNVFYWNNVVHDVLMAHGFDEAAGNFQYKNQSGKGQPNDYVVAQVQDGLGLNNANFSTPPDGSGGRMRLYPFQVNKLTVTAPAAAAGTYNFRRANYGQYLAGRPASLCGNLVLVNDGLSNDGGSHSCASPYVNASAVKGNIALIRLGNCNNPGAFLYTDLDKAKLAQANGATGVIFFNPNSPTSAFQPFNNDAAAAASLTIPVIGLSGNDGAKLAAATAVGCIMEHDGDGSFDNAIIGHEYGHGLSTRLTGGPANSACLPNADGTQVAGEGWSDFIGLWLTTRPGDDGSRPRYVGTYVLNQPFATGPGYRHKPYCTNFGRNNYTYAQLGTGPGQYQENHDVGEVWCTVLWDLNWQLIYKYGYNPDFYAATGGNNLMLKLVLDGCKLQVCNPSFLDSRDALLRADSLGNGHANAALIWSVFARRGMGYSAKAGTKTDGVPQVTGIVEAFDLPPGVQAVVLATQNGVVRGSPLEVYPNPARSQLLVRSALPSATPVQVELLNALGQTVLQASGTAADFRQAGLALNTSQLAAGVYVVRVRTSEGTYASKVRVEP